MNMPPGPAPAPAPAAKPGWFATEGWRWLIVTVLIPLAGFGWDRLQERQHQRDKALESERAQDRAKAEELRNQSELIIKLLPSLAAEPASPQRAVALAMLADLARHNTGRIGDSLFAAVNLAVQETDTRVKAGVATDAERATLTQIAMARDEGVRNPEPTAAPGPAAAPGPGPGAGPGPGPEARPAPPQPISEAPTRGYAISTPRLYVHVFDESQQALADKLRADYAKERRWLTPGIENVVRTAAARGIKLPRGTANARVLYFSSDDEARAQSVVQWLRANGLPDAAAQFSKLKAPPGQIEVWFPNRD
jgi:hypothetical protein